MKIICATCSVSVSTIADRDAQPGKVMLQGRNLGLDICYSIIAAILE